MNKNDVIAPLDPSTQFRNIPTDLDIRNKAKEIEAVHREHNIKAILDKDRRADRFDFLRSQLFVAALTTGISAVVLCMARPSWIRSKSGPYCVGKPSPRKVLIVLALVFVVSMYGPDLYRFVTRRLTRKG